MAPESQHTTPDPSAPKDPPSPSSQRPRPSPEEEGQEATEARQFLVGMKMVGSAMVFIGFIQVFMSASTGAEITVFPLILYFSGMALWAYSSIEKSTVRYVVIGISIVCALGFFHFGEVLFWHKYVIYWGTIGMVVYFMFQTPKKPPNGSQS